MKTTILEDINNFVADRVDMPLDRFFALLAFGLFSLMVLVSVIAPISLSKLVSMIGLLIATFFAVFIAAVNYWMIKMNLTCERVEVEQIVDSIDKPEPIEKIKDDFIA